MTNKNHKAIHSYDNNPINTLISGLKNAFSLTQTLAIFLIIAPFMIGIISFIPSIAWDLVASVAKEPGFSTTKLIALVTGGVITFVAYIFYLFINLLVYAMSIVGGERSSRGEKVEINEAFSEAMSKLWRLIGVILLTFCRAIPFMILIVSAIFFILWIGYVDSDWLALLLPLVSCIIIFLFIIVVRVYMRYALAPFAIFGGAKGVKDAMRQSKSLTSGRLIEVFGIMTIANLVPFINMILASYGGSVLYQQMKDQIETKASWPKPHILNYLVIFIILGMVALILVGTALIASIIMLT